MEIMGNVVIMGMFIHVRDNKRHVVELEDCNFHKNKKYSEYVQAHKLY